MGKVRVCENDGSSFMWVGGTLDHSNSPSFRHGEIDFDMPFVAVFEGADTLALLRAVPAAGWVRLYVC